MSIENLLIILTLSAHLQDIQTSSLILSDISHTSWDARNLFLDFVVDWYFTSYKSRIPKFIELRFTFHEKSFQCFVNTLRISNVNITCLNKTFLLKRTTAEILKDPSYIRCEFLLKCRCIFMVGKHCLRFRRSIDSFLKFT